MTCRPTAPFLLALIACALSVACDPPIDPPPEDAGPADDAGPGDDAGIDPCGDLDADLGSFALGVDFTVEASASRPAGVSRVAALADGVALVGLDANALEVVALGDWPTLGAETALGSVLRPEDTGDTFLSPWLSTSGDQVAAGYTLPFDPGTGAVPGALNIDVEDAVFVDAPGNFSASFAGANLLLNGISLGASDVGAAIYFASLDGQTTGVFATFDPAWSAFSGYTAVTSTGVAVLGGFYAPDDQSELTNRLSAAAPDQVTAALGGEPLALAALPEIALGDMADVAGFGDGVAIVRQVFGEPVSGVERVPLSATDPVIAGATETVLTAGEDCTSVDFIAPLGDDLLLGLSDDQGARIVQVSRNP